MGGILPEGKRRDGAPITAAALENAALHYLARFASSTENLRRVLIRKVRRAAARDGSEVEAGAALVDALVARLARSGILDDALYARAKATSLQRRGTSRRAIAGRLAQKGVDPELVAAALGAVAASVGDSELAAAGALARRRRLGPYRAAALREAARHKDLAAFARAGFALDVARRILACRDGAAVEALLAEAEPTSP